MRSLLHDQAWVDQTNEVILGIEKVFSSLKDSESSQRVYLLTGDEGYLAVYKNYVSQIDPQIRQLEDTMDSNSIEAEKVENLRQKINERIGFLDQTIKVRKEQGLDAAVLILSQGNGKRTMGEVRQIVNDLHKEEEQLLALRNKQTQESLISMYVGITAAIILDVILICLVYFLVNRELKNRDAIEQRKNEFISMASHELKTPLTSMLVFAQVLKQKLRPFQDRKAKHYLNKISEHTQKMIALVNDLLDLSRIQENLIKLESDDVNLNELVKDVVEDMQATTTSHKIMVSGRVSQKVYIDRDRIFQVLINLLSNAVKYSPNAKKVVVRLSEQKNYAIVSVQDFGIGISSSDRSKIFERFFRVTRTYEKTFPGLGIGLYISAQIIQKHKGRIWVKSVEGKGSTFYISLPLVRN